MCGSLVMERIRSQIRRRQKRSAGEPNGADAYRRAIGQPQRLDPDQRRARLQAQQSRQFAAASSWEASINRPSGSRPPAPTISENRVRERSG